MASRTPGALPQKNMLPGTPDMVAEVEHISEGKTREFGRIFPKRLSLNMVNGNNPNPFFPTPCATAGPKEHAMSPSLGTTENTSNENGTELRKLLATVLAGQEKIMKRLDDLQSEVSYLKTQQIRIEGSGGVPPAEPQK
jgi:hypothetical protein